MPTIDIFRKSYEQIKWYPLFFFNAIKEYDFLTNKFKDYWAPEAVYVYEDRNNRIPKCRIESKTEDILFAFGRRCSKKPARNANYIRLELEAFDTKNVEHVKAVLVLFLTKAYNSSDRYSAREFLWMLNSYDIDIDVLSEALETFDKQTIQPFFWNALKHYSMCLSLPKQRQIQEFLDFKGVASNIYIPRSLSEALGCCYPNINFLNENQSIFKLIDIAVRSEKYNNLKLDQYAESIENPTNFFLQIRKWLRDSDYQFADFKTLSNLFRLFFPDVQVLLVKRYFHAVRSGHVKFNRDLLKSFQVNQFENWGTYYHCAHEASKPIRLAVPLLCDSILTFLNSGNTVLQTINGTLDMAYAQCDTNSPDVDFGLKHIVPVCNGGAVPDVPKFSGFICYKIVFTLNEKAFTPEAIIESFRKYLNLYGQQQVELVCHDEETTLQQCHVRLQDEHACDACKSKGINRLDKYLVKFDKEHKRIILRFFTNVAPISDSSVWVEPVQSVITPNEVRQRIVSWLNENLESVAGMKTMLKSGMDIQLQDGWRTKGRTKDIDSNYSSIIRDYLLPSWCIIEPRRNAYIGRSVLNKGKGIDNEFIQKSGISSNDVKIQKEENAIILPRIVAVLNDWLDVLPDKRGIYYIPYDVELLRKLKTAFYTSNEEENSAVFDEKNVGFMTMMARSKYDRYCAPKYDIYCAPKYDNDIDFVTQLPFMWCRGKVCFKTSLGDQTLASCESWSQYTILHLLEILGFPQVTETSGGNEASELIRSFIGMVNNASFLFKRLRCRECNHILFPTMFGNLNRYNRFECKFPTCGEKGKQVYLNHCHHCKTGLIDSRDSAKCPNGWYICPKCLSCCDDAVYEKMASKYVLRRSPIPTKISEKFGHGHNDKGEYFCPKCELTPKSWTD